MTSIEANPATLKMLLRNYALNGLQPHAIHAAAAAQDGHLDLSIGGEFWENSVARSSARSIRVPALGLTSILRKMPLSPTTLICDIEGAEQYLDFSLLPASVAKIIIELHPDVMGRPKTDEILQRLNNQGFQLSAREEETYLLEKRC